MKKILILGLLFSSLTFAQNARLAQPICIDDNGERKLFYTGGLAHFWQDFCNNGLGIYTPQECVEYQRNADPEKLDKEILDFLKKKHRKICGD